MADTKLTALTEISVPALEDLYYIVDDPGGTPASNKITGYRLGGLLVPQVCQGRLTTESGVPISTSDRTAQGTLYWTPCTPDGGATTSGLVGFYDGTRYVVRSLTELSLDLSTAESGGAIDSGENYDVFLDYNGGTPALVIGPSWTNDSTRATALAKQGSLIVLTGDTDWRWVGTIRASGSGVTEDSAGGGTTQVGGKRYVWNANIQIPRPLRVKDTADSWTYASGGGWRQWDNASGNKVEYIVGAIGVEVRATFNGQFKAVDGNNIGMLAIGLDSVSSPFAGCWYQLGYCTTEAWLSMPATLSTLQTAVGYHYLAPIENCTLGTATFIGDASGSSCGFTAWVWG